MRGSGRVLFAAILLMVAGTINIIYGIGAISDANFYAGNTHYVFASVHTWGWITLIVGVLQLTGGFSLAAGNVYGRVIGLTAASIGAIESLLAVGGKYPFWSLGVFAMCIIIIHGILVYGEPETPERARP